ncbi:hypothetical protein RHA1_ro11005 (plasmid) [Rhodococcus jostii RHA1]|uniref:Uncharacterized protein n=1 Tax=Rhodococcus jostii (strain RHA1) TaxID=101510 RepID=Q0RVN4_RHOJR|nr:hypothetical protein [Rhodococcus jostii]ABH00652.1 hypothetical protein RHA1_ro11005 [Rhodococcus jostii RHA1]
MSVDVAVIENVTSGAGVAAPAGGVFPADGVFVEVREGEAWTAGWLVADRIDVSALSVNGVAEDKRLVSVALVPLSPDAPVWQGRVHPDQVVVASVQRPVPVFWDRVAGSLAAVMISRREVATLRERLEGAHADHMKWIDAVATSAHQWADENNLCSEFDQFMEEHGLPPRSREFTVEALVTITTKVSVPVSARSEEVAEDEVDGEVLARALGRRIGGFRRHGLDLREYTVTEVQA